MSSRSAPKPHSAALQQKDAAVSNAGVQAAVRVEAAANEDEPTSGFSLLGDPLFGMAIATGILFAVLAALMALS